jgi:hypothetical protein
MKVSVVVASLIPDSAASSPVATSVPLSSPLLVLPELPLELLPLELVLELLPELLVELPLELVLELVPELLPDEPLDGVAASSPPSSPKSVWPDAQADNETASTIAAQLAFPTRGSTIDGSIGTCEVPRGSHASPESGAGQS